MIVAYAATRNLYPWLVPTITSLLEHNDVETIYLIVEDDHVPDLPEANYTIINVAGQTVFDDSCPNIGTQYTYMAMMRALYADLIPEDRVISLDVDTIICDSLEPIWNMDLTGMWMAAAVEHLAQYKPFGPNQSYYNVGVAVFNLEEMRKDSAPRLLTSLLYARKLPCIEQDALNYYTVFPRKVAELPVRYNESVVTGITKHPAVVHFAGFPDWMVNDRIPRREFLTKYIPPVTKK